MSHDEKKLVNSKLPKKSGANSINKDDENSIDEIRSSTLTRQCSNNIIINISLSNIYIPIDNEKNNRQDVGPLSTKDRQSRSSICREFEGIGALFTALTDEKLKNILYLGVKAGFFHLNGIRKLLGYCNLTIHRKISSLLDAGVIRLAINDEKEKLRKFINVLRMRDYDFKKADFFVLYPDLWKFLAGFPWNDILDSSWCKNRIDDWGKELYQTTHATCKERIKKQSLKTRDKYEKKINRFIDKLHKEITKLYGDKYQDYGPKWMHFRKKVKVIFRYKLAGQDWKKLSQKKYPGDYKDIIFCIEKEKIPPDIFNLKKEKEGSNGGKKDK